MLNLILDTTIALDPGTFGDKLGWIGVVIRAIIGVAGNVGLGIIFFTLILKLITLPLDAYSKVSMRKNNLKLKKMRPQLEKLQKQYQNDQATYNAKMMELYKQNGYSLVGACVPMLVTIVIFMVVLGSFSSYSQYTNEDVYRKMTAAYYDAVTVYMSDDFSEGSPSSVTYTRTDNEGGGYVYTRDEEYDAADALVRVNVRAALVSEAKYDPETQAAEIAALDWESAEKDDPVYTVKTQSVLESTDAKIVANVEAARAANEGADDDKIAYEAVCTLGRDAAQEKYEEAKFSFLWIRNIWLSDVSYVHPVQKESGVPRDIYDEITYNLSSEKSAPNGYFVLIIISVGTMFLSQFIISKSQKDQAELQSADGRGKTTQKVMLIVMPLIFGVFSFMYSAAFSIYMITSNVFGILSTVAINLIIDKKFSKQEEQELRDKYVKRIPSYEKKKDGDRGDKK